MSRGASRYIKTLRLALTFVVQLGWLKYTRPLRGARQQDAASRLYKQQARRFGAFAIEMGGLIVKLGQFMSVRIDLLPKEYIDELSLLQDSLPAVPTPDIIAVIETELGRPLSQTFATFDTTPLAAASLGQVHKATLLDATPVAVKVLRPGIEALVAADLKSLHTILRLVNRLIHIDRFIDLDDLEADFTTTFTNELDYVKEATFAEKFQRNLLTNMRVDIPQIYWQHSTRRVLTMEFMDGVRIDDLPAIDSAHIDRHQLAVDLANTFFSMVLDDGFFHADPHPGNVFVRQDGIIQLIDFGMVGSIDPAARTQYAALVTALAKHDAAGIVASLKELGFLGPGADTATMTKMLGPYIDAIVGDVAGFYTGRSMVDSMMAGRVNLNIDPATLAQIQQFIFTQPITLPGQTTFLGKALITVLGLCLRLDPGMDIVATAGAYMASQNSLSQVVTHLLGDATSLLRDIVPTTKHLISLARKLDDGTLEVELNKAVERRIEQAQAKQTRQIVRSIAIATGAIIVAVLRHRSGPKHHI